jgi:hypothetical protein
LFITEHSLQVAAQEAMATAQGAFSEERHKLSTQLDGLQKDLLRAQAAVAAANDEAADLAQQRSDLQVTLEREIQVCCVVLCFVLCFVCSCRVLCGCVCVCARASALLCVHVHLRAVCCAKGYSV